MVMHGLSALNQGGTSSKQGVKIHSCCSLFPEWGPSLPACPFMSPVSYASFPPPSSAAFQDKQVHPLQASPEPALLLSCWQLPGGAAVPAVLRVPTGLSSCGLFLLVFPSGPHIPPMWAGGCQRERVQSITWAPQAGTAASLGEAGWEESHRDSGGCNEQQHSTAAPSLHHEKQFATALQMA